MSNLYGDLPALTVSCFRANYVESRVGVVTPHFGRQMQLLPLSLFPLSGSFNKRVKNNTLVAHLREAVESFNVGGYQQSKQDLYYGVRSGKRDNVSK